MHTWRSNAMYASDLIVKAYIVSGDNPVSDLIKENYMSSIDEKVNENMDELERAIEYLNDDSPDAKVKITNANFVGVDRVELEIELDDGYEELDNVKFVFEHLEEAINFELEELTVKILSIVHNDISYKIVKEIKHG